MDLAACDLVGLDAGGDGSEEGAHVCNEALGDLVGRTAPMSKKPAIKYDYNREKDRFEITLKRYFLKKKWLRTDLIDSLLAMLDKKSIRHKRGRHVKEPLVSIT